MLALDLFLFVVQILAGRVLPRVSASLGGWVTFLSIVAIVLLAIAGFRWLRTHLLWRLRNRLIVTYVFIGVIPVFLLAVISIIALYLFAGQFASFMITSDIAVHLRSMEASNRAIAHAIANQLANPSDQRNRGRGLEPGVISLARPRRPEWARRQVCVWHKDQREASCSGPEGAPSFEFPSFINGDFRDIVRDHGRLYLRVATTTPPPEPLRVITSEPLDKHLIGEIEEIAGDLGEITVSPNAAAAGTLFSLNQGSRIQSAEDRDSKPTTGQSSGTSSEQNSEGNKQAEQTFSAGTVPSPANAFDRRIAFPIPLQVVDWSTGERERAGALARVETRPSVLYARLFAALGDYARGVEYILFSIAIIFAIIEFLALWIGTKLTRSITSAVAELYDATTHVNRADFSHRITVKSSDQLATLANSFNSMTASIERLVLEQKEKQRLENELSIAQEVQAQLFPKEITQLESLEVHGFCRPARTVSGDYYDFLTLNSERMILAVGDISGKGISSALMMATIHSAVRAYSIEGIPLLREPVAVCTSTEGGLALAADTPGAEVSPSVLIGLLNHQLRIPLGPYVLPGYQGHYGGVAHHEAGRQDSAAGRMLGRVGGSGIQPNAYRIPLGSRLYERDYQGAGGGGPVATEKLGAGNRPGGKHSSTFLACRAAIMHRFGERPTPRRRRPSRRWFPRFRPGPDRGDSGRAVCAGEGGRNQRVKAEG